MIEAATETPGTLLELKHQIVIVAGGRYHHSARTVMTVKLNETEPSIHRSSTPRGPVPDATDFFSPAPPKIDDASIVMRD